MRWIAALLFAAWCLPAAAQTSTAGDTRVDASTQERQAPTDGRVAAIAGSEEPEEGGAEAIEELEEFEIIDDRSRWYSTDYPEAERGLNHLTARPIRRGSVLLVVGHRTRQPMAENPLHGYLGFDGGGMKVGLGLRYGLANALDVGVFRLNGTVEIFDTYQFDFRYQLLRQTESYIDLAVRGGVSWFVQEDREDASGFLVQMLANRLFFDRLLVVGGLLYHSNSSNDRKANTDTNYSLAVAGLVELRISPHLAWDLEVAASVAGYHSKHPTFSTGPKIVTHRHTFSVAISNTEYIADDGVITNTRRGSFDKLIIGFNIAREL